MQRMVMMPSLVMFLMFAIGKVIGTTVIVDVLGPMGSGSLMRPRATWLVQSRTERRTMILGRVGCLGATRRGATVLRCS